MRISIDVEETKKVLHKLLERHFEMQITDLTYSDWNGIQIEGIDRLAITDGPPPTIGPRPGYMTFSTFLQRIQENGWSATGDAQHELIKATYKEIFGIDADSSDDIPF